MHLGLLLPFGAARARGVAGDARQEHYMTPEQYPYPTTTRIAAPPSERKKP